MKAVVVGSEGYIASHLIQVAEQSKIFDSIYKCDRIKRDDIVYIDLEKPAEFDFSSIEQADAMIFTAAISGPDECSNRFDACWNINVTGTAVIIREALRRGMKVIFFSSDAIFGENEQIFNENSIPQAHTPYGKMKLAIEKEFENYNSFKAVRLSYVVSAKDRFVSYCSDCIQKGCVAEIFHPFYRNCITLTNVVNAVLHLITRWDNCPHKAYNIAGTELVSRIRIADEINRITNGSLHYTISKPSEDFMRNRPAITQMSGEYLYDLGILPRESFTQSFRREWNKND